MKDYIKTLKIAALAACAGLFLTGCEKDYDIPDRAERVSLETNATIQELKALYSGSPTVITDNLTVGGVVTTTDAHGNNYRIICIEDETGGLEIKIGSRYNHTLYQMGDTLYVKAQGLCLGAYGGYVTLGVESVAGSSYENDYIDTEFRIKRTIFRGYSGPEVTPAEITDYSQLNSSLLSKRVVIRNAKYVSGDIDTWSYDSNDSSITATAASHYFTIGSGTSQIQVRTSKYANFALDPVPAVGEIVDITGTLTIYGSSYQIVLNNSTDVR